MPAGTSPPTAARGDAGSRSAMLAVLLAVSAVLNVWLWLSDSGPGHEDGGFASRRGAGPRPPVSSGSAPALATCKQQLDTCEQQRKLGPLVLGSFGGRDRDRGDDDDRASDDASEEERAYLCELARQQAQRAWLERKDEIVWALRASLSDAGVQERDMKTAVDRYAEGLDLSPEDRDRFEERYREVRASRIDQVRTLLEADPPDFPQILDEIKALHSDEDRITTELFGEEATVWLRENELDARSSLRAIAATFADMPWEDAIDLP